MMYEVMYALHYRGFHDFGLGDSIFMHDDVTKWKHFPRHWPFVRGIRRSPVNSLHKCQ